MLCYKDRTFCAFDTCKKKDGCNRFATEEIRGDADRLGLGLCVYGSKPKCYEEEKRR